MHLAHDCFMSTIGSLHFTAAVSSLNLTLIPTAYYFLMETQNHTCCKRNYTLLYFYISVELIIWQEVAYLLEKQEFTPKNKTKRKKKKKKRELKFSGNMYFTFSYLERLSLAKVEKLPFVTKK